MASYKSGQVFRYSVLSVALWYCPFLVFLYWQMLMAGAAQSAGIVVWSALCPLATPAQFKRDGGDVAVARRKSGVCGIRDEA